MKATMFVVFVALFFAAVINAAGKVNQNRIVEMKVTAYCTCEKCCGKNACGLTSTGKDATKTIGVAADPKLLPYGTKLRIPGIGECTVDDTGGAMRKDAKKGIYHIDVRFSTHQEALNFGVKHLKVEIID
jgi:3D (Asp-Asp-Asp) domain-containing protein